MTIASVLSFIRSMRSSSPAFTAVLTMLASLVVVMTIYIVFRFVQTGKAPTATVPTVTPTAPAPDPGRAFIRFVNPPTEVTKGSQQTIVFDTNEWSICAVDVYQPDESIFSLTKEQAKPTALAPGRMNWTWNVPANAAQGTWLLRFLCGTAENLATVDQNIEVR